MKSCKIIEYHAIYCETKTMQIFGYDCTTTVDRLSNFIKESEGSKNDLRLNAAFSVEGKTVSPRIIGPK